MKNKIQWQLLMSILLIIGYPGLAKAIYPNFNKEIRTYKVDTLKKNWQIQNSTLVGSDGKFISSESFNPKNWYSTEAPSTVLNTLIKNGVYKKIFVDDNLRKIPEKQFKASWWYRTSFRIGEIKSFYLLKFQGINYKANIWLNGSLISDTTTVNNAFKQYSFDVTRYLKSGKNILAIEVFPPKSGDYTMGFVDWNPAPPDRDMGIFRPVILARNGGIEISRPFVESTLNKSYSAADLTATLLLKNHLSVPVSGIVYIELAGKQIHRDVTIEAGHSIYLQFSPEDFPQMHLDNPRLWWPFTVGKPYLYKASFSFISKNKVMDAKTFDFGIRKVTSFWTKKGHRGIMINGEKILVRGGGWTDNLFLNNTTASVESQLHYVKNMGLNTIRLEGFWGNSEEMYHLCDQEGILVLVGWSCEWEWQEYLGKTCSEEYGGIISNHDVNMMSDAWKDQIIWLRNHPSIIVWFGGSDKHPEPQLEKNYFKIMSQYDSTRIYLASAGECTSLAGPSGVKMRGPYAYEPPVYWFSDTLYGGAFGFNTETGPGAQVPPLESLQRMFSSKHRWPIDSIWNFHCGHNNFSTISRYVDALDARYGEAHSLKEFAKKAQVLNYELMRPMFEAFSAHRYISTGVIQWMLNSAWPELYWQLYDYYLMPTGAYYGAQEANRPVHVLYDYSKNAIDVVNDELNGKSNLSLSIKILNVQSRIVFEKSLAVNIAANTSKQIFQLPDNLPLSKTYFLDLKLLNDEKHVIDNNFYWLSTKKDILDYDANKWFQTPSKQYADYTMLNQLPSTTLAYSFSFKRQKDSTLFKVELKNTGKYLAFFVNTTIEDSKTGKTILPVIWSSNYISLLPGETRILTAEIKNDDLIKESPLLKIEAYNRIEIKSLKK
ncbi:MAG: glycoside hydrolase family 2 [Bacteroidales bacterium]|nr:glycoside hydrolase family 2 [Bacteroidales bacterium]